MSQRICVIWDFPDQTTRFVTGVHHDGLSLPGGYTLYEGATPRTETGSRLNVAQNSTTVSTSSFIAIDEAEAITAWLADNDATLANTKVTRKQGEIGALEATYSVTYWNLVDYSVAARRGGSYVFKLDNVLKMMQRSLYEDIKDGNYRLDEASIGVTLGSGATTIRLETSPKGVWREPGFVFLWSTDERLGELVAYQTIGGTGNQDLEICTRRKWAVGQAAYAFPTEHTEAFQVWVKRGNPLDVMLELLTTTAAGGNGSYDQADGDGLGELIDSTYIDITGIESVRDELWPQPTFDGSDQLTSGTAILLVEKDPIDNLKSFIEENILTPFALYPVITGEEKFSVETFYRFPVPNTAINKEFDVDRFSATQWKRNFQNSRNNFTLLSDWSPEDGEHQYSATKTQATGVSRYGKTAAMLVSNRGGRTGLLGFPDYGSDDNLDTAATKLLLDLANPWTELNVEAFLAYSALGLADGVSLDIRSIPNIGSGARGVVDEQFIVVQRSVDHKKGVAKLRVRQRRTLLRSAFVAPNTVASTYSTASAADKNSCYLTPDSDAQFANGDEAYTVID